MAPSPLARKLRALQRRFDAQLNAEIVALLHELKRFGVTDDELDAMLIRGEEKAKSGNVSKPVR